MTPEPLHIISLGAGVQSSTMALMAAAGEISPMPKCAIFADTQAEPASVYKWLDWLEKQLPFPVHRVTRGSITDVSLTTREKKDGSGKWSKSLIPAYIKNSDGSRGIMGRACTADFKIAPIMKRVRKLGAALGRKEWRRKHKAALRSWAEYIKEKAAAKRERRTCQLPYPKEAWDSMQSDPLVVQWIGISLDETQRMKPSREPWSAHRWPLIEMRMRRADCLLWMEKRGFPKPPRSACVYCPFHSNHEWRRLRDDEPEEFQKAVQFERDLQAVKRVTDNMAGVPFLHSSLMPLDQVDLSTDLERGQGDLWGNECEGMCGV